MDKNRTHPVIENEFYLQNWPQNVEALKVEELAKQLKNAGYELGGTTPAEYSRKITADMQRLQKVISDAGIKPE